MVVPTLLQVCFSDFHIYVSTIFESLVYKNVIAQSEFRRHVHDSSIVLLASPLQVTQVLSLAEAQTGLSIWCHTTDLSEWNLSRQCFFQCAQIKRVR